jgi:hypothetical protein
MPSLQSWNSASQSCIKKLLTINGDIDQYKDMAKRKSAEEIDRSFANENGAFGTEVE